MEQDPDQSLLQPPRRASRAMAAIDTLDPATFDWNAYCGTYKGKLLILGHTNAKVAHSSLDCHTSLS